jgi:hypothetical protein
MNTIVTESEKYYYDCIEAFGNIEDAMKNIAQQANSSTAICTELGCGTLSCTNSLGCPI